MSYITGGSIQAIDYNAFATLASSMNEIFADLHPGATTIAQGADFGYGQTPALAAVLAGNPVLAAEWASLFNTMRNCGTHQGTTVVPPLPVANPVAGDTVVSYNTSISPTAVNDLVTALRTNRHNLALLQSTTIAGTPYPSSSAWTTELTYTTQVDFGSWNNARYFFNSGGFLGLSGSYPSASTPTELAWKAILDTMSPLKFMWNTSTPATGSSNIPPGEPVDWTPPGFYGLTTSYEEIYRKDPSGGSYYTSSTIVVSAKLNATAGTNGIIDFEVKLVDLDPTPDVKAGAISFKCDNTRSTGVITYPGAAVIVAPGVFAYV